MGENNNLNNGFNNAQNNGLNNQQNINPNVKVINTNGANSNVVNNSSINSFNNGGIPKEPLTNPINSEPKKEFITPISAAQSSTTNNKKRIGIQEVLMYMLMVIVIILIILLLLKFCSENSGKSIYKPTNTQNRMTTPTKEVVVTESTTTIVPSTVIIEPTTETTRPTINVVIPGNTTRKPKTTTKTPVKPVNPVNPVTPTGSSKPTTATTSSSTTTTTKKEIIYTYNFTKPTSETYAVKIYKNGQIISASVFVWSMSDELLSVGVVGPDAVVTITTAFADLSSHPKLKFSFQSDAATKYIMTYQS